MVEERYGKLEYHVREIGFMADILARLEFVPVGAHIEGGVVQVTGYSPLFRVLEADELIPLYVAKVARTADGSISSLNLIRPDEVDEAEENEEAELEEIVQKHMAAMAKELVPLLRRGQNDIQG